MYISNDVKNEMVERFQYLKELTGHGVREMSEETGLSKQILYNIQVGRSLPSLEVVYILLQTYPFVDANWLITGKERENSKRLDSACSQSATFKALEQISALAANEARRIEKEINKQRAAFEKQKSEFNEWSYCIQDICNFAESKKEKPRQNPDLSTEKV